MPNVNDQLRYEHYYPYDGPRLGRVLARFGNTDSELACRNELCCATSNVKRPIHMASDSDLRLAVFVASLRSNSSTNRARVLMKRRYSRISASEEGN